MISRGGRDIRWWTWAGYRANATLAATLGSLADEKQRVDEASIRLRGDLTREMWHAVTADAAAQLSLPDIDERALNGLKFNEALPRRLAVATLSASPTSTASPPYSANRPAGSVTARTV
ncbi:hypothetical protein [Amycolatopsis palatopharyngis]|uniref:hypothetical protein n=1 Tax=Amycolatopsis palatopharyngis TaxID=187982 RepID=UPI001B85DCB2|nr:hypothetical protein [Amycolatopsis palatopharyngis]